MLEKQLLNMMRTAKDEGTVVSQRFEGNLELLVYPLQGRPGVIIGVGYGSDNAHLVNMSDVLLRRTKDAARFGAWLPAVFRDGSHFVVMRVDQEVSDENAAADLVSNLHIAQELLS